MITLSAAVDEETTIVLFFSASFFGHHRILLLQLLACRTFTLKTARVSRSPRVFFQHVAGVFFPARCWLLF